MDTTPRPLPDLVAAAQRQAEDSGFVWSCIPEVGRLLTVAAAAKPAGVIAESGTGVGVGAAWLHAGLGTDARLVTVEQDPDRAARAAALFDGDPRVRILVGDWRLLEAHAPFDVFFCDGGGKREDPERVVDLLAPGGLLVLDDFTPPLSWPPRLNGELDELRMFYLGHPKLSATEVMTTPDSTAIIATRLAS
ncbi:MAG: transferase [Catenulispora sp.]|nr:transferase [Catenulispora sp.]